MAAEFVNAHTGERVAVDIVRRVARWDDAAKCYELPPGAPAPGYWVMMGSDREKWRTLRGALAALRASLKRDGAGYQPGTRYVVEEMRWPREPGTPDYVVATVLVYPPDRARRTG